ncbi:hypothetical protein [Chryseobacterium indoltheticum]|uniref:hypothetical protein n=1 Tax=Chryseobacterium indoltheticum TaxID=254 RepID=UPI001E480410|nr:hypothetical protein [Chryseobacterium indoltheticum]
MFNINNKYTYEVKVLGKPVLLNVCNVVFLSHNNDGHVNFFMQNGFEISINTFFSAVEQILNSALEGKEDEILILILEIIYGGF